MTVVQTVILVANLASIAALFGVLAVMVIHLAVSRLRPRLPALLKWFWIPLAFMFVVLGASIITVQLGLDR